MSVQVRKAILCTPLTSIQLATQITSTSVSMTLNKPNCTQIQMASAFMVLIVVLCLMQALEMLTR